MKTGLPHILIVDDILNNLQITAKILKDAGYAISLALDGNSGLAQMDEIVPDLVLLDVMMPGMDGFDVCRTMKKNPKLKDIPVIFLTARNDGDDLIEGFNAGGVDYVSKPFNSQELLARVKTHLDLSFSKKQLRETLLARDKLYSVIAHDIRSPLASINLAITVINRGQINPNSERFKEIFRFMERSITETGKLIDNLLEWTNMQTGSMTLFPHYINTYTIICECYELLAGNAWDKQITLLNEMPPQTEAFADATTIHSVFRNLVSNAIKYTPNNGSITVSSVLNDGFLEISVKDTGVGIPDDMIKTIFDGDKLLSTPGTNEERGTGLGTRLIKDFVALNGGKLSVESVLNQGTIFRVLLPTRPTETNAIDK